MILSYYYAVEFAKEQKEIFGGDMNAFLDVAIECIEKQIPKKPEKDKKHSWWVCPTCKKEFYWDTDYGQQKFKFCPNCSQAIEWGDENE